jgi:fimbrial isopeptide formation D2 family protein/LPXTG-motif cell wall-anchored protein
MEGGTPVQFLHGENTNERKENLMKNFKKIMALLIAAMMIVGTMNMVGASAVSTRDTQLKVSGFEKGDTVKFYKILSYNANTFDFGGWVLLAPFDGIVGQEVIIDNSNPSAPVKKTPANKAEAVEMIINNYSADLLGQLARMTGSATAIDPTTQSDTEATYDIDNDTKIGLYMALITAKDPDYVYNPVLVSSDMNDVTGVHNNEWIVTSDATYSDSAAAKKSKVGIKKEDSAGQESYNQDTSSLKWRSTRIGETVNYTVTSTIPGYGPVFTDPVFEITDNLKYMKLFGEPVVTTPAGLTKGTDYTITPDPAKDSTTFTVSFSKTYLKTVTVPTTVVITYEAVVTGDAPLTVNREENEVSVKYNHDPVHQDRFNYEMDETEHYTYTIDAATLFDKGLQGNRSGSEIVKVGLKADKVTPITSEKIYSQVTEDRYWEGALAGATFRLLDANKDPYKGSPYAEGKVKNFDYENIVSQADGRFEIPGLDAGTYYLEEVSAPKGYIKDNHVAEIIITPTFTTINRTKWTDGNNWVDAPDQTHIYDSTFDVEVLDKYTVTVDGDTTTHVFKNDGGKEIYWSYDGSTEKPHNFKNIEGVELPSTGGMGTTLFYAIGAILVLGAGILLVSKRRMSAY